MESAREALEVVERDGASTDVILIDMFMPEADGVDLITSLKSVGYAGSIAIVSGGDDRVLAGAELLAKSKGLELLGSIKKPVSSDDLKALLMKAVSAKS